MKLVIFGKVCVEFEVKSVMFEEELEFEEVAIDEISKKIKKTEEIEMKEDQKIDQKSEEDDRSG
ncbi:hypothetical protein HanRHA438_Chr00c22g0852901 [Helianthus annuus]|nr:hypothetical protein HanIR_Chr02g0098941 [Helianthus annuus]KAJ0954224.1 hypothetical protein HanRHA438_Chr00c22g0852901 [Helianthus annuus]